jgi:hypothetical protein
MGGDRQLMPGAGIEGVQVRSFLAALILFFIVIPGYSFAQNNQTESLGITTYYPAPYGVYKNPRLFPGPEPTAPEENQPGTMFFNQSDKLLYIYNGNLNKWEKVGSGSSAGSGFKIYSGHGVSPNGCGEFLVSGHGTELCTWDAWYGTITFPTAFKSPPQVIVVTERNPDYEKSPCASNMTDAVTAYADQITNTSFRIWAHGSPDYWSECGHPPHPHEGTQAHAKVGWIAIGK